MSVRGRVEQWIACACPTLLARLPPPLLLCYPPRSVAVQTAQSEDVSLSLATALCEVVAGRHVCHVQSAVEHSHLHASLVYTLSCLG